MSSHVFTVSTKYRHGSHCLVIWNVWNFRVWNYKLFLQLASKIQVRTCLKFSFVANSSVGGFISFKEHYVSGPIVATVLHITERTHPPRITSEELCPIIFFTWTGSKEKQENISLINQISFECQISLPVAPLGCPLSWFPASQLSFSQHLREITFYICTFLLVMSSFLL